MRLVNLRTGDVIAFQIKEASDFLSRLAGLTGKRSMPPGSALVLMPCKSVHTFFMRFNVDVVFLDKGGRVLRVIDDLPPSRISPVVRGSRKVVELPGGTVKDRVRAGDVLAITR